MKIENVPFGLIDWSRIEPTTHPGIEGEAYWRTFEQGNIRLRIVEYTPGYMAEHWCRKGHILFVLDGELTAKLKDGRCFILKPGTSYHVSEEFASCRSETETGALLFIID